MKIIIGSDHRGYELKEKLKKKFEKENMQFVDVGTNEVKREDFPKFAFLVGENMTQNSLGVLICGSGGGMVIAANKVKGARCVMCYSEKEVIRAREHDHCNVLALASEKTSSKKAFKMIKKAMETPFLEGRYKDRIEMIQRYESGLQEHGSK